MGSLEEKATRLKRIVIEPDEDFVVEIRKGDVKMSEIITRVVSLEYNIKYGSSYAKLSTQILNPIK